MKSTYLFPYVFSGITKLIMYVCNSVLIRKLTVGSQVLFICELVGKGMNFHLQIDTIFCGSNFLKFDTLRDKNSGTVTK